MKNDEIMEKFRTTAELEHDYKNSQMCFALLQVYNRRTACEFCTKIVSEYEAEINTHGFLIDGRNLNYSNEFDSLTDEQIKEQLQYLGNHIPIYVMIRKGEENLAKQLSTFISGGRK